MVTRAWPRFLCRDGLGLLAALLAGLAIYNTFLNDAYESGPTLYDSAIFATILWHSGWELHVGTTLGGGSYYYTHVSPIHYLPNLISYFFPADRITYYALVYSTIYAAMIFTAYRLIKSLYTGRFSAFIAALGAMIFFCSQSVFEGSWEPHMEILCPLFGILTYRAWQFRHYWQAVFFFLLNCAVREDFAIINGLPLVMLGMAQYYKIRVVDPTQAQERFRWAIRLGVIAFCYSLAAFAVQKSFFPGFNLLGYYFDAQHPFSHLTVDLLIYRMKHIFYVCRGMWLPLLVIAISAIIFRDIELMIGALGFLPYSVILFFSRYTLMAEWGCYSPFPMILPLLWPAIMSITADDRSRRRYRLLQCIVLVCGLSYVGNYQINEAKERWVRHPFTYNGAAYLQFGEEQINKEKPFSGHVRASHGIRALYPYQFPGYVNPNVEEIGTIIWFDGDRDQAQTDELLKQEDFTVISIPNTKIKIGRRELSKSAGCSVKEK